MSPGISSTPLPRGFFASGVNCGVRRYRPDVGLIYSEHDCVAAGIYTLNEAKAAPIIYCQGLLPSSRVRAVLTNSGQANAGTGRRGEENNLSLARAVAAVVGVDAEQVLVASTGRIGPQLEMDKLLPAMPELFARATAVADGFALAILTTDLVPKSVTTEVVLSGGVVRLTGICKGSGMIHPEMGTMIAYLLTDAAMDVPLAQSLLREATDLSFNMISVDGDCSTNDCGFLLANGASGIRIESAEDAERFRHALNEVSRFLARAIAADGEGASKLIEVTVRHAPSLELARAAARGVTLSPLVKTAMHGEDPNWGRILSRLGQARVPRAALERMSLRMQGVRLFADGAPCAIDREAVRQLLKTNRVEVEIDLHAGAASATAWGCDLSRKYVDINVEYS